MKRYRTPKRITLYESHEAIYANSGARTGELAPGDVFIVVVNDVFAYSILSGTKFGWCWVSPYDMSSMEVAES
jgi:hypothetical protein